MLDKYIKISESRMVCGQTSSGVWYCKELPAETTKQLDKLIGEVNNIMNKYNKKERNKTSPKPPLVKM